MVFLVLRPISLFSPFRKQDIPYAHLYIATLRYGVAVLHVLRRCLDS